MAAPNAVVTLLSSVSGIRYAPHTVFVHATASDLGGGNNTWNSCKFEWDFGDSLQLMTITDPRPSKGQTIKLNSNTDGPQHGQQGFNAAYIYENPGTYNIRLKITNREGLSHTSAPVAVTVTARPAGNTRFASASASGTGDGLSEGNPWTLAQVFSNLAPGMRVRWKRGDTFTMTQGRSIGPANVRFDTYGTGARPKFLYTGADGIDLFSVNSENFVVEDFDVETNLSPSLTKCWVPKPAGRCTIRRCTWGDQKMGKFVNGTSAPHGLLVFDCDGVRTRGHTIDSSKGSNYNYIGCRFLGGATNENLARWGLSGTPAPGNESQLLSVQYSHFNFEQVGANPRGYRWASVKWGTAFRSRFEAGKHNFSFDSNYTQFIVYDSNFIRCGETGTFEGSPNPDTASGRDILIPGHNSQDHTIRNCIIEKRPLLNPHSANYKPWAVRADKSNTFVPPTDAARYLWYHNTLVDRAFPFGHGKNFGGGHPDFVSRDWQFRGNLWVLGSTMTEVYINGPGLTGISYVRDVFDDREPPNYSYTNVHTSFAAFAAEGYCTNVAKDPNITPNDLVAPDYRPNPATHTVATTNAVPVGGVFHDYHGNQRPTSGTWYAGAVDSGESVPPGTVSFSGNVTATTQAGAAITGSGVLVTFAANVQADTLASAAALVDGAQEIRGSLTVDYILRIRR